MTGVRESVIRGVGLGAALLYTALIVWIYVRQPETLAQVRGGVAASIGAYRVDQQAFSEGLRLFHLDRFEAARAAFERADPAERDPRTQFYIAYSYYRQGWHRLYHDDALFAEGLKAAEKAVALDPEGRLEVNETGLLLRTPRELRAELQSGLTREPNDFNPLRVFEGRK
jgi:tetratricopeptide (TPR) repeat protein